MTTSAQLSGTGNDSANPSRNSTLPGPASRALFLAMREHRPCHIDSDDLSVWTNHLRRDQTIEASTTTDIDDPLAGLELADAKWVACAGERCYRAFRNTFQPVIVVAEHAGEWTARVEVIASLRLL